MSQGTTKTVLLLAGNSNIVRNIPLYLRALLSPEYQVITALDRVFSSNKLDTEDKALRELTQTVSHWIHNNEYVSNSLKEILHVTDVIPNKSRHNYDPKKARLVCQYLSTRDCISSTPYTFAFFHPNLNEVLPCKNGTDITPDDIDIFRQLILQPCQTDLTQALQSGCSFSTIGSWLAEKLHTKR